MLYGFAQAVGDAGAGAQVGFLGFGHHKDEDGGQVVQEADGDKLCVVDIGKRA
jgi:hypothetical protein